MGIQGIVMTITSNFREGILTVMRKRVCERESREKRETERKGAIEREMQG